jgi:hypothetical protein
MVQRGGVRMHPMTRSQWRKKSMSEIPGQSGRALPDLCAGSFHFWTSPALQDTCIFDGKGKSQRAKLGAKRDS